MLHFGKYISDITERTYNSNGRHEAEKMTYPQDMALIISRKPETKMMN